jgi:putative methionine-R-sulfoxide reductase with GAF domain
MQDRGQSVRVIDDIPITEGHPGQVYAQGVTLNVANVAAHSAHVSTSDGNMHLLTVPIIAQMHDSQNLEHTALALIQVRICGLN